MPDNPSTASFYAEPGEPERSILRDHAAEAENLHQLHKEQLDLIYRERWFRMFVPVSLGGPGLSLPEVLRIEEGIAFADGSTAWVVTLCSGAGWFAGFLDPHLASEIFSNEKACLAGSGAPSGRAEIRPDGFVVSGEWKYATGALYATMFTANCIITRDGIPVTNQDGSPRVKAFIFSRDEVLVRKSWNSMGMIATGSHQFAIKDLFVSSTRAFTIDGEQATFPDPMYQFPFMQLAETTIAVNFSGMALRFLELIGPLIEERMAKDSSYKTDHVAIHESSVKTLRECRAIFYQRVGESWTYCESGRKIPEAILQDVSNISYKLYLTSLTQVGGLYRYAGMVAADPREELNRIWRNIHTASQHTLFSTR